MSAADEFENPLAPRPPRSDEPGRDLARLDAGDLCRWCLVPLCSTPAGVVICPDCDPIL